MLEDFKLKGKVDLDDAEATEKLGSLGEKGNKAGSMLEGSMLKAGLAVGVASKATALLMSTLNSAVTEFKNLDTNLAKVNTLLDKQVVSTNQLRMELLKVSEATGIYASELANASYEALSAGVETRNLSEFIEEMTVLAQGGFTSVTKAVDVTTSIMNAYGKEVYTVKEITDKLVTAQRYGKTTVDEMAQSLYNVVPAAASLGIGLDEVLAGIAQLTARGVPTAQATTQMRQAILDLADDTSGAGEQFKILTGKRFVDFIKEGGNLVQAIAILEEGARKANVPLLSLFSRIEGGQAAVTLATDNTKEFNKQILLMGESAGEAEKAQKEATDNMAFNWNQLKNRILADFSSESGLWRSLNDGLFAFSRNTYDFIKNTFKLLTLPYQLGKGFDELNEKVKTATGQTTANNADGSQFEEDYTVDVTTPIIGEIDLEKRKNTEEKIKTKTPEQLAREREREERRSWLEENKAYNDQRDIIETEYNQSKFQKDIDFFNQISEMRNSYLYDEKDIDIAYQDYEYEKFLADQEFKLQQLEADRMFYEGKEGYAVEYAETMAKIKELEAKNLEHSLNREEQLRNRDISFTQRVNKSKENLIKGAYSTLITTNDNMLKALSKFFLDSISNMMAAHGAELLYTGIKNVADGIALSANPATPGIGAPLIAAGKNQIAQSALFAVGAGALKAIGGATGVEGGNSSGSVPGYSSDIDNTDSVVSSIEKEKSVTVYTDGDMKDVLLSMLYTLNDLAKDYDNINIVSK